MYLFKDNQEILITDYLKNLSLQIEQETSVFKQYDLTLVYNEVDAIYKKQLKIDEISQSIDVMIYKFFLNANNLKEVDDDLFQSFVDDFNKNLKFVNDFKASEYYDDTLKYFFIEKLENYRNILTDFLTFDFNNSKYKITKEKLKII